VEVVAERGTAGTSVGLVIVRAGVSRRVFYERFAGLEECLIAVLDMALERAAPLVVEAFDDSTPTHPWQDGMRCALGGMLAFFDEEPALARVCMVEMGAAARVVRAHRERILQAFGALVLARIDPDVSHPSPLAAEGIYASVLGIVNARLVGDRQGPLLELLGPLMGIIVGPFVDQAGVAEEIERGNQLARELLAERRPRPLPLSDARAPSAEVADVTIPVAIPRALASASAYRARQCLLHVQAHAGASNREVAQGIGVSHHGQVSALLARLERRGLLAKRAGGPGRPNAWSVTAHGELVANALRERDLT
jgi:AcrR family transcriptional regulator